MLYEDAARSPFAESFVLILSFHVSADLRTDTSSPIVLSIRKS